MNYPVRQFPLGVTCAFICAAGLVTAPAGTILQQSGETFIAFEAELNGDVLNGPVQSFGAIADGTASGGSALMVTHPTNPIFNAGGADGNTPSTSFVAWTLDILNPGTYTLYYTVRTDSATLALDVNAGNSFFFAPNFSATVNDRSASNDIGNLPTFTFFSEPVTFTVASAGLYTFRIGDREAGTILDRFVFSSVNLPNKAAFDAIPNSSFVPEPASLVLLALATPLFGLRRLHQKR